HQTLLRKISQQALQLLQQGQILEDHLPASLLQEFKLPTLAEAIQYVHRPPPNASLSKLSEGQHPAQKRLILEELLAHHLSLQDLRNQHRQHDAIVLGSQNHLLHRFIKSLPFELTPAQLKVNQVILGDLEQQQPMMRLVQGDVGSGKTVVAALACLKAIDAGYQSVLMAPTEILAEQHYQNFKAWFEPLGITVAWLSGKLKGKKRQQMLDLIAGAEAMMVVGTHALFQDDVQFNRLALAVIDEQHRFGVHQRLALRDKGAADGQVVHQLIMTATPIPRSLAMTAYADLDYSVIDELPPGRTPVTTVAIGEERREDVIQRVKQACTEGKQAYWVCTLIEESDVLQCQAAEDTSAMLASQLPDLSIGLVHGRLKAAEKEQIMQQFKQGAIDLLVATTVIEVGVDVANASLMIIENAERLGLSQLHQLRGRVGRGSAVSHCVLMYRNPLSQLAKARLSIMRKTNSGFEIAQKDLEIRGPGEVLGTRQTGNIVMRIADVVRDEYLLDEVKQIAHKLSLQQPASIQPIIRRWLGQQQAYGSIG
ncbi:MAG: ATP-dependent DNA helicase RecG, partial [Gammaproteobacteria bacterium]|nr:ATP-dependent DNA helicase RecG [Gammaproteobacteria bacterium]